MKRGLAIGVFSLILVGCAQRPKDVETVQVSGTVLIAGKPVSDIEIRFFTKEFEGYGMTDEHGKYSLVVGAQAGKNKITFSKKSAPSQAGAIQLDPEHGIDEGQIRMAQEALTGVTGGRANAAKKDLIAEQYSNFKKTPISFVVPEQGTDKADFQLPVK